MKSRSGNHPKFQALLTERATAMRDNLTPSEARLWSELSASKLGVAFRRQVPIGRFIAGFLAPSLRLIVEVDGGYHTGRSAADCHRDRDLRRLGYVVLHLDAELVLGDLPQAVALVRSAIAAAPPKR